MKKHSIQLILLVVLVLGFYLRFKAADHPYISQWDEAYHALVAKHFTSHPLVPTLYETPPLEYNYKEWSSNNIWLHKPPMALWLMAASIWTLGEEEVVFRIPSIVLGTFSILLTYLIGYKLLGNIAGLIGAALHSLNPLFIRLVSGTIPSDHIDLIMVFFVELTVLFYVYAANRNSFFFFAMAGISLGFGFLSKSFPAMIGFVAILPLFGKGKKLFLKDIWRLLYSLLWFAGIILPWKIYTAVKWPNEFTWEQTYTLKHFFTVIEGHSHPWYKYLELIPFHYGGIKTIAYIVILGSCAYGSYLFFKSRDPRLLSVILLAFLPYIVFSVSKTNLYSFIAPAVPGVLLLVGFCISSLVPFLQKLMSKGMVLKYRIFALSITLFGMIYIVSIFAERIKADYSICPWNLLYDCNHFRTEMKKIGRIPGNKIVLNVGDGKAIQAMYYGDLIAYPVVPSHKEIRKLFSKEYKVFMVVDFRQRNYKKNLKQIQGLRSAGLLEKIQLIPIKGPTVIAKNPYFN